MTLYRQKYRVESTRLKNWNYDSNGYYFVTICALEGKSFFGRIEEEQVHLSPIGKIVEEEWRKTGKIRANICLDKWILMPNHLHGIVVIMNEGARIPSEWPQRETETPSRGVSTGHWPLITTEHQPLVETPWRGVSTTLSCAARSQWRPNSIGSIIGQFKSICTKRIRAMGVSDFGWQSRFYDHIIEDDESLNEIREYIINNPRKWELETHNPRRDAPVGRLHYVGDPIETPRRGISTARSIHGVETPRWGVSTGKQAKELDERNQCHF
ncbi:MAG: hypothetical protein HY644_01110 [Acidobacteria bacterium]|nr:hypothetical protein [Acidobacteriota bacterium]